MTGLSSSPRLIKGALLAVDLFNPLASVEVFQYNLTTMTRSLEARAAGGDTVLSYQDFGFLHPGHSLFLAHQIAKKVVGSLNVVNTIQNVVSGL